MADSKMDGQTAQAGVKTIKLHPDGGSGHIQHRHTPYEATVDAVGVSALVMRLPPLHLLLQPSFLPRKSATHDSNSSTGTSTSGPIVAASA